MWEVGYILYFALITHPCFIDGETQWGLERLWFSFLNLVGKKMLLRKVLVGQILVPIGKGVKRVTWHEEENVG